MKTYQLRHYDIVDGSVNDVYIWGDIDIPTTRQVYNEGLDSEFVENKPTDTQIVKSLKACGFLNKYLRVNLFDFDGDNKTIYLNLASTGEPFCELLLKTE